MVGNPVDERFRPPDPEVGEEELNVQSKTNEMTDGASSSSSHLREEAIQVATIEAEMDEFRHNREIDRNLSSQGGDMQMADNLQQLVRGVSQRIGVENIQAIGMEKLSSMEAAREIESAKSSSMEAAQSISGVNRLDNSKQKSITGVSSQEMNLSSQQEQVNRGVRNFNPRHKAVMVDSQGIQPTGNRDVQKGIQSSQIQQRTDNSYKESEIYQQQQQIDSTNTRNTNSRTPAVQQIQNR
ncbi:hypothetical protein EJD97_023848 [Solanum chilense]|uniref:Uncharacterized protein n=1 Tax=Solanum chilense TaxID=4083 RepID=A0A6N2AGA0_SOLCI|nr:hypothetical protein EJD97_023848 [Solanum chilense]